ncbi:phage tail sheath C-terminal domain-containing protein [Chitinophaga sp. sic0106]|uniref:phage tail sheath family protein n=1 Tax=Chitinophaga sp. sic0106 TaxID=2854785 RepID=UPI001C491C7D|nr:phage tail sheath C-terminal domain-containing protein [Chitinophaga sp. sic0106]MBV7530813.1 phage tail sheath subtilisin-like domain-containing protein [Chitinophaga sp. sic0106]
MATYRSPGVYVEEISLLAPSIAEVQSAIPAFVGYTEQAKQLAADDLLKVATPINSWADFLQLYGGPDKEAGANITIAVDEIRPAAVTTGYKVTVTPKTDSMSPFLLYYAVKQYFANGGGRCYIVSVGYYDDGIKESDLTEGLNLIGLEDEPTLLVVPEAVRLNDGDYKKVIGGMLSQASSMKDRFAILDTRTCTLPKTTTSINTDVKTIYDGTVSDYEVLRYGAAYYPFLESVYNFAFDFAALTLTTHTIAGAAPGGEDKTGKTMLQLKSSASAMYNAIAAEYGKYHVVLPPSAAVAGAYARVDNSRGVWKAPANVGLNDVVKPLVAVSRPEQDLININTESGKSIDAILSIPGSGTVIMGARTLDGNSNEWKYVNVRRFFSVVEESVQKSTRWVVFEPNTASTWIKVQSMIENYLFLKWRDGALAGAKPEQAFFVNVGLGKTMTPVDVLEGRLIVEIGMAVARPAEFIILRFEQKLQTS